MSTKPAGMIFPSQVLFRAALALGSALVALWLLRPFIPALTGVWLLSLAMRPAYAWLLRRTRNRTLSALLSVGLVIVLIVVPAGLILNLVVGDAIQALTFFRSPVFWNSLQSAMQSANSFASSHGLDIARGDAAGSFQRLLNLAASTLVSLVTVSFQAITQLVAMLFLLFFSFRDSSRWRSRFYALAPFSRGELRRISSRVRDTVKGTVAGRLIVAAIQGVLAWGAFWALRIPGAAFLGSLTAVCAVLPAVGAYFVWLPVVLYMALLHAWTRALILLAVGSTILSTVDNFLFPVIAGSRTRMATAPMFLSLFGGVYTFGISGLILGPVIWSLAEALLAISLGHSSPRSSDLAVQSTDTLPLH